MIPANLLCDTEGKPFIRTSDFSHKGDGFKGETREVINEK
jgi:hypothetical protein